VKEKYQVTFDSLEGKQFVLHKWDGSDQVFTESHCGLYYTDMSDTSFLFNINTGLVNNNYKYPSLDYSKATPARKTQQIIGRPSTKDFIYPLDNNLFSNCPVTRMNILAAEHIFGPDLGSL